MSWKDVGVVIRTAISVLFCSAGVQLQNQGRHREKIRCTVPMRGDGDGYGEQGTNKILGHCKASGRSAEQQQPTPSARGTLN